jgi:hypothetical protein
VLSVGILNETPLHSFKRVNRIGGTYFTVQLLGDITVNWWWGGEGEGGREREREREGEEKEREGADLFHLVQHPF